MIPKTIRLAYAIPPLVAVVLACLALIQLDQRGVVGATSTITVIENGPAWSNARIAGALEHSADRTGATIVRTVPDRRSPAARRTLLTTSAAQSRGGEWLMHGYRDFDTDLETTVHPIANLDRIDPVGDYQVFGDRLALNEFAAVFERAGYDVLLASLPSLTATAFEEGVGGAKTLLAVAAAACVVLCIIGTLGSPRRISIGLLAGRSPWRVLLSEAAAMRGALAALLCTMIAAALVLLVYNGLAMVGALATIASVFAVVLATPLMVTHLLGALATTRLPVVQSVRGRRPAGFVVGLSIFARVPVAILLVSACFAAVGSAARAADGSTARDLHAAGESVQVWVSSDRAPGSEPPWEAIGVMARAALQRGDAFLAAPITISNAREKHVLTGMYVDAGYLEHQHLRASDGSMIEAASDEVGIWVPEAQASTSARVLALLEEWELRGASSAGVLRTTTDVLASGQKAYTYPSDDNSAAWTSTATVIVLPQGSRILSDDDLGALVSTGGVVFRNERAALRAIHGSSLASQFSAVVSVGQVAADTARQQSVAARVDIVTALAALSVAVLSLSMATIIHRRRFGTSVFGRHACGWSFIRSNRGLLGVEAALFGGSIAAVAVTWSGLAPDAAGFHSAHDPAALSAPIGALVACGASLFVAGTSVFTFAVTARRAVRDHGRET